MDPRPVINVEEHIGKTVGRRRPPSKPAEMQLVLNSALKSQGHKICPKGVFRFHSHEEADEWMLKMMRPRKAN